MLYLLDADVETFVFYHLRYYNTLLFPDFNSPL